MERTKIRRIIFDDWLWAFSTSQSLGVSSLCSFHFSLIPLVFPFLLLFFSSFPLTGIFLPVWVLKCKGKQERNEKWWTQVRDTLLSFISNREKNVFQKLKTEMLEKRHSFLPFSFLSTIQFVSRGNRRSWEKEIKKEREETEEG